MTVDGALRVVIGEDVFLTREAIEGLLRSADGIELVAACEDFDTLRAAVQRERPDVVLTDLRMPPTHSDEGIRLARELRTKEPQIGVVVLSQHAEPEYASMLFEDGPQGRAYLLKESLRDRSELLRALRTVAEGGSVVDPLIVQELLTAQRQRRESPVESLTPRELEILGLIAEGRSNAAIAVELVVTKRAVERHINSIFLKLGLRDSENVSRRVKAALLYLSGDGADAG
jgi:DNA-binding NarL/FixJ family response regulator